MTRAIIIDIDGTLANCDHRQHHVQNKPKDWKAFYDSMENDEENYWCGMLIEKFCVSYRILLVSGRPEDYRAKTEKWLKEHLIIYDDLFMRPQGDHRQDSIVKKELYEKHIKDKYEILFVIDDRKQVVDMWRAQGLTCLQCAEGNF